MDLPIRIGRYEVIRLLGQGGMGRVLLAKDAVLGRHVAIKILRDDLGLPPESRAALFARMQQEARAAAAIEHPHLVTLHDMGEEPVVGLYLVFEYLTGPTLRDKIAEGPLDMVMVARMARDLGDALTTAHEAGVVHRDVKPENVILSTRGAKVTDFGIARLPDSTLTAAGSVLGTPAYSAPEALALGKFSPASDQFSLAATIFEAICTRRAFPGEDALAIAGRIATEPAPPLPFTAADPRLVSRLDAVLGRALSKDPAARYPSCRAFGEALVAVVEARVIDTPRISDTPPPRSLIPRATRRVHNVIAGVALLVIALLIAFGRGAGDGISLHHVAQDFAAAVLGADHGTRGAESPSGARASDSARRRPHGAPSAAASGASAERTAPTARAADPEPRDAGPLETTFDASEATLLDPKPSSSH
jgi:eukaryotic-like serine/threonine-protein kinase